MGILRDGRAVVLRRTLSSPLRKTPRSKVNAVPTLWKLLTDGLYLNTLALLRGKKWRKVPKIGTSAPKLHVTRGRVVDVPWSVRAHDRREGEDESPRALSRRAVVHGR